MLSRNSPLWQGTRPRTVTSPALGALSPARIFSMVVFPGAVRPHQRGGREARSLLDVFLHDLRGYGRGITDHAVLLGRQVVCGQVRNGLTGRPAHRQIPGLIAVALMRGSARVKHDVRGEAGFRRPRPRRDRAGPYAGLSGDAASLADRAGEGAGRRRLLP